MEITKDQLKDALEEVRPSDELLTDEVVEVLIDEVHKRIERLIGFGRSVDIARQIKGILEKWPFVAAFMRYQKVAVEEWRVPPDELLEITGFGTTSRRFGPMGPYKYFLHIEDHGIKPECRVKYIHTEAPPPNSKVVAITSKCELRWSKKGGSPASPLPYEAVKSN